MNLELNLEVTHSKSIKTINLSDYDMDSETWESMSKESQEEWLFDNVVDPFDPPSWVINSFSVE